MTSSSPQLKREVGLLGLTSIVVGGMVGSGIFGLLGSGFTVGGPAFLIGIALVGLIVMLLALIYSELGSTYPVTGGPYALPRKALGDFGGFLMGWGYFLYAFIGTAAIIDVFVVYLGSYVGGLTVSGGSLTLSLLGIGVALVFLGIFTALNLVGVRWGSVFAIVSTFAKLIPLILFTGLGLLFFKAGNLTAFGFAPYGWAGIGFGMSLVFFAYTGFEAVAIPSEEVKNPQKVIPRATLLSVGVVTILYFVVGLAFAGGVGIPGGSWGSVSPLLSDVATGLGLAWLATLVVIGALISTAGAGGDWVLLQGRMPFAMAKDNLFFRSLSRVHPKFGTPTSSLLFASVLTGVVLILLPSFPSVALIASITTLVPYAAAALALLVLRRKDPGTPRPYRLPGATFLAPAAFVLSSILIYWASWPWTLVGVVLMGAGLPLYFLFRRPNLHEAGRIAWLGAYLGGLAVLSYLGDPFYVYQNFLSWGGSPIAPLGILTMQPVPYDLVVLVLFSVSMFVWGYYSALSPEAAEPTAQADLRSVAHSSADRT
ncbi:MAG TPA: amino acid permease [Thermoplasmata archaeon]|nr:amino acid permease [Thermoplasmata archaeon]